MLWAIIKEVFYCQTVSVDLHLEQLHKKWLLGGPCTQCAQGGSRCGGESQHLEQQESVALSRDHSLAA